MLVAGSLLLSCAGRRGTGVPDPDPVRLGARPRARGTVDGPTGLQELGLDAGRDGFLFVPARATSADPLALVLMLHGAGGNGRAGLAPFLDQAEEGGVILLAPDSRGRTWDVLLQGWGPDVAFLDRALEHTFARYPVGPGRVSVEGFSDGASYALGLGLANGDLFRRIVAFSPGYVPRSAAEGRPHIYVSHGIHDPVLPIDRCSRRIVPALQTRGYDVRYHEFDGGHDVPASIAEEALALL